MAAATQQATPAVKETFHFINKPEGTMLILPPQCSYPDEKQMP